MHDQSFLKIVTEEMLNPLSVEGGGWGGGGGGGGGI